MQQNQKYKDYECRFDVIAYNTSNNNNKNESDVTLGTQPNQRLEINRPEWLQGAFIVSAW